GSVPAAMHASVAATFLGLPEAVDHAAAARYLSVTPDAAQKGVHDCHKPHRLHQVLAGRAIPARSGPVTGVATRASVAVVQRTVRLLGAVVVTEAVPW